MTFALLPGSPAMDSGSNSLAVTPSGNFLGVDERGDPRLYNNIVDIAAFEAQPLTFTVLNTNDGGTYSLPNYILVNNEMGGGNTIDFNIPSDRGYNSTTGAFTITLTYGQLTISANLVINGLGQNQLLLNGNNANGIFDIDQGVSATLAGMTIENGNALTGGAEDGGAIDNLGSLSISGITFTGNRAYSGGAIYNATTATLMIDSSSFTNNTASNGGAIDNTGSVNISDTTLANNVAAQGGAISNYQNSTLTIQASTLADNSSTWDGGSIFNYGNLFLYDSTLAGNVASNEGGGIYFFIFSQAFLANDTIANNICDNTSSNQEVGGGGIWVDSSPETLPILNNTIVANNFNDAAVPVPDDIAGVVNSTSAYNLIGTGGSGGLQQGVNGNQVDTTDPGLAPLGGYGGPTQTLALLPGSPAINAGSDALAVDAQGNPLYIDQRGQQRIYGASADIGAFETDGDSLEALLQQVLTPTASVSVQAYSTTDVDNVINAVNQLPSYSDNPVTVTVNLSAGNSYGDITASPPAGVTLVINGLPGGSDTIVGHSPALIVSSGTVIVTNETLTTTTADPTILVTGGSLELRDDDIESSTGSAQAAISISGGSVDLGTAASPGGNVLNINGTGTWIQNTTSNPVPVVGDTFEINGTAQSVVTWTGTDNNGQWDDGNNWSTGNVPGSSDVALITQAGITITLGDGSNQTVGNIQCQANLSLSSGSLTISGPSIVAGILTVAGGTLAEASSLTVGSFDWTGGTISGSGDLIVTGSAMLQETPGYYLYLVNGTLTLQGATSWVNTTVIGYTGTENLINEGTLTFSGNSYFSLEYVEANFTNDGVIEQDSVGSSTYLWGNFTNHGSVDVEQGLFEMGFVYGTPVTTTSTGTVYGAPGTILAFTGNQILQAPSDPSQDSINGDTVYFGDSGYGLPGEYGNGSVTVQGAYNATMATVFYAGDTTFQGPVVSVGTSLEVLGGSTDFTGTTAEARTLQTLTVNGTLTSNDPYTVTGTTTITGVFIDSATSQTADLDWTSGYIKGTGDLVVTGMATLQATPGYSLYLVNGTLTLQGTTSWVNTTVIGYTGTENLINEGTLTFSGNSYFSLEYVEANFTNDGVIEQDSVGSSTYLWGNFTNHGSVDVEQGLFEMGFVYGTPVTTTSTGTVYGAPGTILAFTGNQILQAPSDPSQDSINGDTVYFGDSGYGLPGEYGNGSVTVQGAYNATMATVFYAGDTTFQGPVVSVGTSLEVLGGSTDFTGTTAEARTLQTLTVNGTLTSNDPYTVTGHDDDHGCIHRFGDQPDCRPRLDQWLHQRDRRPGSDGHGDTASNAWVFPVSGQWHTDASRHHQLGQYHSDWLHGHGKPHQRGNADVFGYLVLLA